MNTIWLGQARDDRGMEWDVTLSYHPKEVVKELANCLAEGAKEIKLTKLDKSDFDELFRNTKSH